MSSTRARWSALALRAPTAAAFASPVARIYLLTANGATNWHQFASYVVDRAIANGIPFQLNSSKIHAITSEEYPVPAKRAKNSRLDTTLLSSRLGLQLPDWTVHANRTIDQLTLSH